MNNMTNGMFYKVKTGIKVFFREIIKPDVFATFTNYIVKIFLNPIIILFVPVFLSESSQGYWYTFGSIAALSTLADLGFTTIMTQYTAHEYTYLNLSQGQRVFVGDRNRIARMASLYKFMIKWLAFVLAIASIIIYVVGLMVFSARNEYVSWRIPWGLYVIGTLIVFFAETNLAFFEGCAQFSITQKIRTAAGLSHCLATILLLVRGYGLFALPIPLFLKSLVITLLILFRFGNAIKQLVLFSIDERISWVREFIPLLLKYAISWISGYFSIQIFNPISFAMYGSVVAGKVGYSLSIITAIYSVASVWSFLSIPRYNMDVEKHNWNDMDKLLRKNIMYSLSTYSMGVIFVCFLYIIPFTNELLCNRILPFKTLLILAMGYLFMIFSYCLSTYLRAHKEEPFVVPSVLTGVISTSLTLLFTHMLGENYVFLGIFIANGIALPICIFIWSSFRKSQHCS